MTQELTGHLNAKPTAPSRPERSLAVFLLASVLFVKPFLGIFDRGGTTTVAGIPLLFAYLFAVWALVIALMAYIMESRAGAIRQTDLGTDNSHGAASQANSKDAGTSEHDVTGDGAGGGNGGR